LCGRRDLIGSALLQQLDLDFLYEDWNPPADLIDKHALRGVPRNGIGRSCKVGKEQIAGVLTALQLFIEEGDAARNARYARILDGLVSAMATLPGLTVERIEDRAHGVGSSLVEMRVAASAAPKSAALLEARLRKGNPSIHVDGTNADEGVLVLAPACLTIDDVPVIAAAVASAWQQA
jgi:L-seryl-tRNA(Ser) seleniumtransferase